MKRFTLLCSLIVFAMLWIPEQSLAQNSTYISGKLAYDQGDYDLALEKLNKALDKPQALKAKNLSMAWLYKGKSLKQIMIAASQSKDMDKLKTFEKGYLNAAECFLKADETASDERHKKDIAYEMEMIFMSLLQGGLSYTNNGDCVSAMDYFNTCIRISKKVKPTNTYLAYDLKGQCALAMRDTTLASSSLEQAIMVYNAAPPATPDLLLGYAYYRLALIDRYQKNDAGAALNRLKEGKATIEKEWSRFAGMNASDAQRTKMASTKADVLSDLGSFELDVYLNYPEKYTEAVVEFNNAVEKDPSNVIKRIAYASLLEKSDINAALKQYEKAITLDPNNFIAHFNIGSMYVNEGVIYAKAANEEDDFEKATKMQEQVKEMFKKAFPYFEKAHQIDPKDIAAVDALMQITINLDMLEEYMKYKKISKALKGG